MEEPAIRDRDAGYLPWEVGKQPDFVLELASVSTARNDLTRKRDIYAMMGIPEYWRFDATGGAYYGDPLVGEQLVDGDYEPLPITDEPDGNPKGYSPVLGLPSPGSTVYSGYSILPKTITRKPPARVCRL